MLLVVDRSTVFVDGAIHMNSQIRQINSGTFQIHKMADRTIITVTLCDNFSGKG